MLTADELDEIPNREVPQEVARNLPLEVYDALLDRHERGNKNCKRCITRIGKCPYKDGFLHEQQVGIDPKTKDRFFVARCDNPGCPTRRREPLETRAERLAREAEEKKTSP